MQKNIETVLYYENDKTLVGINRRLEELQTQPTSLTEYDESLVRRLIEKGSVYENKFTVEFKSRMTVDIEA